MNDAPVKDEMAESCKSHNPVNPNSNKPPPIPARPICAIMRGKMKAKRLRSAD